MVHNVVASIKDATVVVEPKFLSLEVKEPTIKIILELQGQPFINGSFNWMIFTKSLHGKWLEITISIHKKLVGFRVPG